MVGIHDFWLFLLSAWLLYVTPGPDTLYIVGRSTSQGLKGGVCAALGIGTGALVHVAAAALGLSALLAASATAFTVVKIIGALYLLYVGVGLIRSAGTRAGAPLAAPPLPLRRVFLQGFLTNVLNPKVALFFLAFLPQFVAADAPSKALAFVILGIVFDLNGTAWNLFVAWSTARLSARLAPGDAFRACFNRCVGGLFIVIGVRLAFTRP